LPSVTLEIYGAPVKYTLPALIDVKINDPTMFNEADSLTQLSIKNILKWDLSTLTYTFMPVPTLTLGTS
jgi:hypothetical protein